MLLKDVEPIYSGTLDSLVMSNALSCQLSLGPTPKPVLQKYRETIDGANTLYLHLCK